MKIEEARDLLAMIEVKEPNELIVNSWWGSFVEDYKEALQRAIKSLEAWEKVKKEIDDSISACESDAMRDTWCNGEHVGFIESQDIIERCIEELEAGDDNSKND
jgi:hypothetical protein